MRHFGIYANSGDVQTAISAGTLVNPYVALVSGALDYNSVVPVPPTPPTPSSAIGLTVITSDGSVFTGSTEEGISYGVSFEKPYDSTFTVYWNGEVATAETGEVDYQRCPGGWDGYVVFDMRAFDNTELEDLDYGTQFGEEGDVVTVDLSYSLPSETGCGEDEPFDEPCPGSVFINISNENCYGCEGTDDPCGCVGGEDDGEGNCDCGGDPECECRLNGGYWDGTKCWYRAFPCRIGEWSADGEGTYTLQITNPDDAAWGGDVYIGQLTDVYFNGDGPMSKDVMLSFDGTYWTVTFHEPNESANPSHQFEDGSSENWYCDEVTPDLDSSTANVLVSYDGVDTFVFSDGATGEAALSMYIFDPECSEEDPGE